jgi:hypothetical protein
MQPTATFVYCVCTVTILQLLRQLVIPLTVIFSRPAHYPTIMGAALAKNVGDPCFRIFSVYDEASMM